MITSTSRGLIHRDYFLCGYLKCELFQKKIAHNSGTEICFQIRERIHSKILNKSLHLQKSVIFGGNKRTFNNKEVVQMLKCVDIKKTVWSLPTLESVSLGRVKTGITSNMERPMDRPSFLTTQDDTENDDEHEAKEEDQHR
jgi:hypothetical protein